MSKNKIDSNLLGEKIVNELKQVYDPEIPVDVYELGKNLNDINVSKLSSCRESSKRS